MTRAVLRPGAAALTAAPVATGRTPVTVLAGDRDAVEGALKRWIGQRGPGQRWALVDGAAADQSPAALAEPSDPDLAVTVFSAGCACCVAASAFSLVLARLLRMGPWHRLLIALPGQADPAAVADALLGGPIAAALADLEIVWVLRSAPALGLAAPPSPASSSQPMQASAAWRAFAAADLVLVEDGLRPQARILESWRARDPGCDPLWFEGPASSQDWDRVRARLGAVRNAMRWRWFVSPPARAVVSESLPQQGLALVEGERVPRAAGWVWPASIVFDRRAVEGVLQAVARLPDVAEVRAVIRTRREWYAFAADADLAHTGRPLAQPDAAMRWRPTASRRESRIECLARPGRRLDSAALTAQWLACLVGQAAG